MVRAVLFDVDGTLLDTDDALVQTFSHVFRKFGFPAPRREDIVRWAGKTGHRWLLELLPRHSRRLAPQMHELLVRSYAGRFLPQEGRLMEGARESVAALRAAGVRTAVITNMRKPVLAAALERFRLEGLFDALVTAEAAAAPKPAGLPLRVALRRLRVPPEEALFVGDTEVDVRAGRHAGVRVVLLNNARNTSVRGAWRRVDSLADLPALAGV